MRLVKIHLLLLFLILGLYACSPKLQSSSAEVNFLYKEAQGVIVVKSIGYGKSLSDAVQDAQKSAFRIILFRGLPGTDLNVPLITDGDNVVQQHQDYFKKFFDQGYYKNFMMSSTESSNLIKINGMNKISVDVKINYNSLRIDLENFRIIRKFGL